MSEVVGSTPSFTRSGRRSASFSRSSFSLMICAAPCFKNARASSGCMINHRIANRAGPLLVFVQQFTHLFDRERFILSRQRLLAFTFVQERPVLCVRAADNFFARLRSITKTMRGLNRICRPGISECLLRRNPGCAALAAERLRIELPRGEVACSGKNFRIRFLLDVKRAHGRLFIYGCPISDEFFVLCRIPQSHVRPQQAIEQLAFLFLGANARESSQKQ